MIFERPKIWPPVGEDGCGHPQKKVDKSPHLYFDDTHYGWRCRQCKKLWAEKDGVFELRAILQFPSAQEVGRRLVEIIKEAGEKYQ